MKKLVGFFVLLILAGGGWWYWVKYGTPPEKAQVLTTGISQGDITEAVTATGALEPVRRYDVGSQVSGVVKAIHADYNSIVKEGQLLAEIDPSLLQVQVDIQRANIERQTSDIANQKVQLDDQKRQLERTRALAERGLQNQQQLEAAELSVKTREAQIASAEKSLIQANANLASAEMNVGYTKIKAPADGVIVERKVDVGQTVQASMQAPSFFVMATPLEKLKLTALVDEAEIGKIRPGMDVKFTVDAYGQQPFNGTVEAVRLNATNSNNVVSYPVWITVLNPGLKLRPSMTASLRIIVSTAPGVIRVPNTALRFRPNTEIYTALGIPPPAAGQGRTAGPGGSPETNAAPRGRGDQANAGPAEAGGQPGAAGTAKPGAANTTKPGGTAQPGQNANAQPGGNQPGGRNNRQPGQGGGNQAGQGGNQAGQSQAGQNGRGGNGRTNPQMANMTPEQLQAFMERYARGGGAGAGATGGRGGQPGGGRQGQGGRGMGAGQRGATQPSSVAPEDADKIDELWAELIPIETTGTVWTWNEAKKELTPYRLRLGVTDGQFTRLISGDIKPGDVVVTSVIPPASMRQNATTNPLLQQQNRGGGMGGMTGPGGGGAGGGGGGGAAGGGRGGAAGGGGGGGRGGN